MNSAAQAKRLLGGDVNGGGGGGGVIWRLGSWEPFAKNSGNPPPIVTSPGELWQGPGWVARGCEPPRCPRRLGPKLLLLRGWGETVSKWGTGAIGWFLSPGIFISKGKHGCRSGRAPFQGGRTPADTRVPAVTAPGAVCSRALIPGWEGGTRAVSSAALPAHRASLPPRKMKVCKDPRFPTWFNPTQHWAWDQTSQSAFKRGWDSSDSRWGGGGEKRPG